MDRYNALHIRQAPNLRQALADAFNDGSVLMGCVSDLASVDVAKLIAATKPDWVFLDTNNGAYYSPSLLVEIIQTLRMFSGGFVIPVVRAASHSHDWILWALEAGAGGIVVPHTETADQVRESINASRFPPEGRRSFMPFALIPGIEDVAPKSQTWRDVANAHIAVIPQIESGLGVENLEEILQVEGVDAIMIGPNELLLNLGCEIAFQAALKRIYALASKYKKPLMGGIVQKDTIVEKQAAGYRMMARAVDTLVLVRGIEAELQSAQDIISNMKTVQSGAEQTNGHTIM